jgi:hypothetical protein
MKTPSKTSNSLIKKFTLALLFIFLLSISTEAQYKSYIISVKGDTLNIVDKNGLKQGRWVVHVDPLRGEPGYEAEGVFINNKKEGLWRKYDLTGDLIAIENYKYGGKDGICRYFSPEGELLREESWLAYNPDNPYDTIPIYGPGNNNVIGFKIVKAEPYSVKNGDWNYYDKYTGRIDRVEKYDHNRLLQSPKPIAAADTVKVNKIPPEVLEYQKKYSGKKHVKVRTGETSN